MKKIICFLCLAIVVLNLTSCSNEISAYNSGIENEKKALSYVSSVYGLNSTIVSKWAGNQDLIAGRQPDIFIMKDENQENFPFCIEFDNEELIDYYPSAFMGNEIRKSLSSFMLNEYKDDLTDIECCSYVYTDEKKLLTNISDINELSDRKIEISAFIVADKANYNNMLFSVFDYNQKVFDDFTLKVFFVNESECQTIRKFLDENIPTLISLENIGIHPKASFEYYKGTEEENLSYEEVVSMLEYSTSN